VPALEKSLSLKRETSRPAVSILFLSSLVSGIFWFNNSAIYPFIASNLKLGISVLGLMSASFLIGVGLTQIPSGLLSIRFGPKGAILVGTGLSSLATLATALESNPVYLIGLRLVVGAGLALMFSPGVSLVASYFPPGKEGFGVGVYDSVSLTGGMFAYIGDSLLASFFGWRAALEFDGMLGIVVGVAFFLILPKETLSEGFRIHFPKVRNVLLDPWILTVGFSLLGLEFASALVGNFMVYYLSSGLKEVALFAGLIGSVLPAAGITSSTLFGRIFDRTNKTKALMMVTGILSAVGLSISAFNDLGGSILSTLAVGFFGSAGFIVCVAASRQLSDRHDREYEVLGVGWVITMSLFGSFFGPILFSLAVVSFGYESAWIFSGLISLGFFLPLLASMIRRYPNP
jgi:MFS family permease